MKKAKIVALVWLVVNLQVVQASLIDYGTYSTDTSTSLDWLDTTLTAGFSYFAIKNGAGGWIGDGWRYATGTEVSNLFTTYVGTEPELTVFGSSFDRALSLVRQLGVNVSFNTSEGVKRVDYWPGFYQIATQGFFDDGNTNNMAGVGSLAARINGGTLTPDLSLSSRWVAYPDFWSSNSAELGLGSFLVRNTAQEITVPEPSILTLLLLSWQLIWFIIRRQKLRE